MSGYVDGFVIPILKKNISAYKKMASLGGKVWMEHGALQYFECVGEELKVHSDPADPSKFASPFAKKFNLKPNETVIFSWILYKSKADRNKINKKVMKDPRMNMEHFDLKKMPFDMRKMLYAGFVPIVRH